MPLNEQWISAASAAALMSRVPHPAGLCQHFLAVVIERSDRDRFDLSVAIATRLSLFKRLRLAEDVTEQIARMNVTIYELRAALAEVERWLTEFRARVAPTLYRVGVQDLTVPSIDQVRSGVGEALAFGIELV